MFALLGLITFIVGIYAIYQQHKINKAVNDAVTIAKAFNPKDIPDALIK